MKKALWVIIFLLVAIIIAADISAFIAGSFEWYPTEEQIEKGRIVYGAILVPLATIEAFVLTRIFKKK